MQDWLVWSVEHGAWWRGNRNGYASRVTEAGRFSFEQASEICRDANMFFQRHSNWPYETMVRVVDVPAIERLDEKPTS